jgi:hypothetical protein
MFPNRSIAALIVCTLALALAQNPAAAGDNSFQIIGGGIAPMGLPLPGEGGRPHWAVGAATDLGLYYGQGEVETDTAYPQPDGTIIGDFGSPVPFVFTDAKGDKLACYYGRIDFGAKQPGSFELVPVPELGPGWYVANFIAEFVPYGPQCTGKFKGVSGSWMMYATTAPFVLGASDPIPYTWEGQGSLTLKNGH